jgi:hypothetical protein
VYGCPCVEIIEGFFWKRDFRMRIVFMIVI